jgi:type II secretory pathway component GspD/PulD (secretin)
VKKILISFLLLFSLTVSAYADEERYDFNFPVGTNLSNALYAIVHTNGGREIILNVDDKPVKMALANKTVDEAMDLMAQAYNFSWRVDKNAIIVTPGEEGGYTQTRLFNLKYASTKLIKETLLSFVPDGKIRINPDYNTIAIDSTPGVLKKVEDVISQMDQPQDQIFIMVQMIEVSREDAIKLGFQYTLPSYDSTVKPFKAQFTITSEADRDITNGEVLAKPTITTFNGQEATLLCGDEVPVISTSSTDGTTSSSVTFKPVGAQIKVTPYVNDKEKKLITMNLEPNISSVAAWITAGDTKAPQISTRTAKTQVRVKSGEHIVMGGLMRRSDIETIKGIPGLMDLPVLGKFFQHKDREKKNSEIFFVVTPYLLDDDTTVEQLQKLIKTGRLDGDKKESPASEKTEESEPLPVPEPEKSKSSPTVDAVKIIPGESTPLATVTPIDPVTVPQM